MYVMLCYVSYLMNGEDALKCVACDCNLTVEHILIEYGKFVEVGQIHYNAEYIRIKCCRKGLQDELELFRFVTIARCGGTYL